MQVLQWIRKYNGNVQFFIESVDFSDRTEDWNEITMGAGVEPIVVIAEDVSYTRRRRAYWTNFDNDDFDCVTDQADAGTTLA